MTDARTRTVSCIASLLLITSRALAADAGASAGTVAVDISGEQGVPGIVRALPEGKRTLPRVAFDGTQYLVVWADTRGDDSDIFGARIDRDGNVLDPTGIAISTAVHEQGNPEVTFDGQNFVIAWLDYPNNGGAVVYAARVTPGGHVLDPDGIAVSSRDSLDELWTIGVASNGTTTLVLWGGRDAKEWPRLWGARVDREGRVLEPAGLMPVTLRAANGSYGPDPSDVVWGGSHYLLAWYERPAWYEPGDAFTLKIGGDGQLVDPTPQPLGVVPGATVGLMWNGSEYVWAWSSGNAVQALRIAQDGTAIGTPLDLLPGSAVFPAFAHGDSGYLMITGSSSFGDCCGEGVTLMNPVTMRLANDLSPLGPVAVYGSSTPTQVDNPAVCAGGSDFLLVSTDQSGIDQSVEARRITGDGTSLDPDGIRVSWAANAQHTPALASNSSGELAVWRDARDGIYAARLDLAGALIDPAGVVVSPTTTSNYPPSVAFDGRDWVIVYNKGGVHAARLAPDGTVRDPNGIDVASNAYNQVASSIACSQAVCLIAWAEYSAPIAHEQPVTNTTRVARLTPDGVVLDPAGLDVLDDSAFPAVGTDGKDFLVCDGRANCATVDASGKITATASLGIGSSVRPAITYDGTHYLVAWRDYSSAIRVARLDDTLSVSAAATLPSNTVGDPSITFDGSAVIVVWPESALGRSDLHGAWLTRDLVPLEPNLPISSEPSAEVAPAIVSAQPGRTLLAYERFALPPLSAKRVFLRTLDSTVTLTPTPVSDAATSESDGGLAPDAGAPDELSRGCTCGVAHRRPSTAIGLVLTALLMCVGGSRRRRVAPC